MIRIAVDPSGPDPAAIERVARVIREGGVAAIPTDTLYGLAADPFNPDAVRRLFLLKGRTADRALPLVAADVHQARHWLGELSPLGRKLADRFWPGALTLLVVPTARLAPDVTGGLATVGLRVPAHAVTRALCAACGHPLTATSANISGEPPTADPEEVFRCVGRLVDVTLDAGRTPGGAASTIVDVTSLEPRLIRPGAVSWEAIQACVQQP